MNPYDRIDKLYSLIPSIKCQGKCQESCGPILMSRMEWKRIIKRVGHEPKSEKLLDPCPMLNQESGQCTVYAIRPAICRLWGVVEKMRCPWGCVPERYLQDPEAHMILDKVEQAGA